MNFEDELKIPADESAITDAEVFEVFDFSYPGLEEVGKAWKEGWVDEAKKLLVSYFEHRKNVVHFYDYRALPLQPIPEDVNPYMFQASLCLSSTSMKPFCLSAARKMMQNVYVSPGGKRGEHDFGPNLENEFHYNAKSDTTKKHRSLFSIFTRVQFFEYLMFLYHEEGDKAVLAKYEEWLRYFFKTYPVVVEDFSVGAGHLMYTEDRDVMNLAWEGFVLTEMLYTRMTYELDYHMVFEIIKHLWFIGMQLRRYDKDAYHPYNHHFFERGVAPFFFSIMFPEIPAFVCVKEHAAAICLRHIKEDYNADGGYSELSLGYWYGAAVSEMLYRLVAIANLNDYPLLDEDAKARIDKTLSLFSYLVTTGQFLPSIGDNNGPIIDPILRLGAEFLGNKDCKALWEYRNGKGPYPADLVKYYANDKTGFVIARSAVGPDTNGFIMSAKVNCEGCGHNHMDMLSMVIMLRGRTIVSEPYTRRLYHAAPQQSIQRGYMYDMDSHNTVLCYDQPIQSWDKYAFRFGVYRPDSPITAYVPYEKGMYVASHHYGYTFCAHTRKVLFLDSGNMLVRDEVANGDRLEKAHVQRWNFVPGVGVERIAHNAVRITSGSVASLWVWDSNIDIRIFKQTEILSRFFKPEEIGWTMDVSFGPSDAVNKEQHMLVRLSTLMLDVTDKGEECNPEKLAVVAKEIGDCIATPQAYALLGKVGL